jgi:hypothetical protein
MNVTLLSSRFIVILLVNYFLIIITMIGQYLSNPVFIKRMRENISLDISDGYFVVNELHKPGLRTMVKSYLALMLNLNG